MSEPARRVLVTFAHPAFQRSRVNRFLVEAARAVEGITFHDLYEAYPDFDIDVAREQELAESHDVLVWQHPFFWYSAPSLVKEWLDLVLEHGWAYGTGGDALAGRTWAHAITAGGTEETYCSAGRNQFTVRQLLAPFEQTARLCGMRFLAPFVVFGTHQLDAAAARSQGGRYRAWLEALRDGTLDQTTATGEGGCHGPAPAP